MTAVRGRLVRSTKLFRSAEILVAVLICGTHAAPPPLDALYPAGSGRGTTNAITVVGKFDSWPPKIWVSGDGISFAAETNRGKLSVTISSNAQPGPRLIRFYNDDGASEPRTFVIGDGRELTEAEPNNHFAKAQRVGELPFTVNGRLDKSGDVDSFAIELRAGQWLDARVDCYTLMSKVDAVLRLVTTNGEQLAWNHDFITLDPRLIWRAPTNQTVVAQIFGFDYPPGSDIRLTGGEATVYRLHISASDNLPAVCAPPTEQEPNNTPETAQDSQLPASLHGIIGVADDEDRFRFTAKKDEFVEVRVEAASLGSPLDAWLKIEDSAGNQLARNDDADGSRDPRLEWNVPANGTFFAAVGSVTHRGGEDFCYRLSLQQAKPDFRATLAASSLVLTTGGTNELKIDLKRLRGFTNELVPIFQSLPDGVIALTTNLLQKDGNASIQISAATNAPNFQGPVQLALIDSSTKLKRTVAAELTTRGETGFNRLLVEAIDEFWLTVRPKAAPASNAPAKK